LNGANTHPHQTHDGLFSVRSREGGSGGKKREELVLSVRRMWWVSRKKREGEKRRSFFERKSLPRADIQR